MAIEGYQDVYSADEYERRVKDIDSELTHWLNSGIIETLKDKVKKEIESLQKKENKIYEILHIKDKTLQSLNKRLQEYNEAVLNLSGSGLNEQVIAVLKEQNAQKYAFYRQETEQLFEREILPKLTEGLTQDAAFEELTTEYLNYLRDALGDKNKRYYSSVKGLSKQNIGQIAYSSLTPEQRQRWINILNEKFDIKYNKNQVITIFHWQEVTKNLTQKEAKKGDKTIIDNNRPKSQTYDIDAINNKVIEYIKKIAPKDQSLLEDIIKHRVLEKNRYAFFVGDNINDIIGILGEIQGLYYLAKLMGAKTYSDLDNTTNLAWRGGTYTGEQNTKPHQDILLGKFGIQVKNSIDEDFHEITFQNASLDTVLSKTNLSDDIKHLIINYYGTINFNVPYDYADKKYFQVRAPEEAMDSSKKDVYVNSYNTLHGLNQQIEQLLSLCASAFLYMDVTKGAQKADANVLYLIGGTAFITASLILSNILSKLEYEQRNIKFNLKASDSTNPKNIVSALNDHKRSKGDYSGVVIRNMVLQSSFDFGSIDPKDLYFS